MKVAFVIDRLINFKFYGTLIQESLNRGHNVSCWLNHRDTSRTTKWYEFPSTDKIPKFNGPPLSIKTFRSADDLAQLNESERPDFVFSPQPPPIPKLPNQAWAHLITAFCDSFCTLSLQQLDEFDLLFNDTPTWVDKCFLLHNLAGNEPAPPELIAKLRNKIFSTGMPQYDQFKMTDRNSARHALKIPLDKKVVTLFKFETQASFWSNKIFHEKSRPKRLFNVLCVPLTYYNFFSRIGKAKFPRLLLKSFIDRFRFLPQIYITPTEDEVLRAVRAFCDNNGYFLALKYRKKNPLKAIHREVADAAIADDEYFPYTSCVAIKASDLVITLWSTAVAEAATAGVPSVNLMINDSNMFYSDQYQLLYLVNADKRAQSEIAICYNNDEDGLFNKKGLIYPMSIYTFPSLFPSLSLSNFPMNKDSQAEYLARNINSTGRPPTSSILNILESRSSTKHR